MYRLLEMKECLLEEARSQMDNLEHVDAKELGEVIDMVKDIEEAIYYSTVTEAMKGNSERYNKHGWSWDGSGRNVYKEHPAEMIDHREGRSPKNRRLYMEAKEMHHDKIKQMQELELYLKELSTDIAEMIEDATAEEKTLLKTKLSNLLTRI